MTSMTLSTYLYIHYITIPYPIDELLLVLNLFILLPLNFLNFATSISNVNGGQLSLNEVARHPKMTYVKAGQKLQPETANKMHQIILKVNEVVDAVDRRTKDERERTYPRN